MTCLVRVYLAPAPVCYRWRQGPRGCGHWRGTGIGDESSGGPLGQRNLTRGKSGIKKRMTLACAKIIHKLYRNSCSYTCIKIHIFINNVLIIIPHNKKFGSSFDLANLTVDGRIKNLKFSGGCNVSAVVAPRLRRSNNYIQMAHSPNIILAKFSRYTVLLCYYL